MNLYNSFLARRQGFILKNFYKTRYGKSLRVLKDIHKNKRCFIVANGPSLQAQDLDFLENNNEITFGMNRIFKMFNKTNWRPTYYVCEDINILRMYR